MMSSCCDGHTHQSGIVSTLHSVTTRTTRSHCSFHVLVQRKRAEHASAHMTNAVRHAIISAVAFLLFRMWKGGGSADSVNQGRTRTRARKEKNANSRLTRLSSGSM